MTTTYAELKKQIAELEQAANAARKAETAEAISKIQSIMNDYGLTVADIDSKKSRSVKSRTTVPVQFVNPETNETWTGRGRAPRWLDGKDRERYRIKS
ncbi:H-NS family nucleoid-associated regulatory protein [Duganella sp. Dugasp56]|uniref:H-NS histone family protein n=1 Tax=Duganella sp. Dugasp56 TaxID=3243046 RepID=UPI0039AEB4AC